jgi:hypothetical protein
MVTYISDYTNTSYIRWNSLACRGPIEQMEDEEVEGELLVGKKHILEWETEENLYGNDLCYLFPAINNGERCWVRRDEWEPAYGYSAEGIAEYIISFEEGLRLLIQYYRA